MIRVSDLKDNIEGSNIHVIGGPRKESERTLEYFGSQNLSAILNQA